MKPRLLDCPAHLTTYTFLLGAEHLILDCKQTSVPPGALWEGQQTHLDQPEGRKERTYEFNHEFKNYFIFSTTLKTIYYKNKCTCEKFGSSSTIPGLSGWFGICRTNVPTGGA